VGKRGFGWCLRRGLDGGSDEADRAWVFREGCVRCHQCDPFGRRLSGEHSIEGISMNWWQAVDCESVLASDCEFLIAAVYKFAPQHMRIRTKAAIFSVAFDGYFP